MSGVRYFVLVCSLLWSQGASAFSPLAAVYLTEKGFKLAFVYWLATKKSGSEAKKQNSIEFFLDHTEEEDLRAADAFATAVASDLDQLNKLAANLNDYIKRFRQRQLLGLEPGRRLKALRKLLASYQAEASDGASDKTKLVQRYQQLILTQVRRVERHHIKILSFDDSTVGAALLELIYHRLQAGESKEAILDELVISAK